MFAGPGELGGGADATREQDGVNNDNGRSAGVGQSAAQPRRRGQNKTKGTLLPSPEDQVYGDLIVHLDDAHAVEVEQLMAGNTRCSRDIAHSL